MEGVIVGVIVIKEVTSAGIALYTGTGIVSDCVTHYRENRLREKIRIDKENARERNWEDLETGNTVEIPIFDTKAQDEKGSQEFDEKEWMFI